MRLVLHIGTPKTATTTLQHFVYANRAGLLRQGVGLSDALGTPVNRALQAWCLPEGSDDEWFTFKRLTTEPARRSWFAEMEADFAAEIAQLRQTCHTMLISTEQLYERVTDLAMITRLHGFLSQHFQDMTVLVYVREQSSFARSAYSMAMKSGGSHTFETAVKRCEPGRLRYDYKASLDLWAAVFGVGNIRARLFQTADLLDGDIRRDLLAQLAPGLQDQNFEYDGPRLNESLGGFGQRLARLINQINPKLDDTSRVLRRQLIEMVEKNVLSARGHLAFPEAGAIHAAFAEPNRAFAATYLNRADNPFAAPAPRLGGPDLIDLSGGPDPEALLALFAEILQRLHDARPQSRRMVRQMAPVASPMKPRKRRRLEQRGKL